MMAAEMSPAAGLCGTCNNAVSCFFHARRGPALFCELFDNYVEPAQDPPALRPRSSTAANGHTGLCMNCENRSTCRHPRPEGGIWHCESYE